MFDYLKANGINLRLGAPYSPELQGVAERVNTSIFEIARCMLKDAKLPDDLWAEACSTAAYIKNRSSKYLTVLNSDKVKMANMVNIKSPPWFFIQL
jgi:transposase InsO family protein